MKNVIALSIAVLLSAGTLFAQEDTLKARAGDWGVALNVTGLFDNIGLSNSTDLVGNNMLQANPIITLSKLCPAIKFINSRIPKLIGLAM